MFGLKKAEYKIKAVPFDAWRILRGDRVQVMSGKSKGMRGQVKKVIRKRNQVIVEGVNLVKKHQAGTGEMKGGVYLMEAPVAVASVSLIDPQDDRPCKTKWVYLEGGEKERQSKRTGVIVPRNKLILLARTQEISEGPYDTAPADVTKMTFDASELVPKLNFNRPSKHPKRPQIIIEEVKAEPSRKNKD